MIIETMSKIPTATVLLVLFMALAASLLVHQILKTEFYATLFSVPGLLFAGLLSNTLFVMNGAALSPDKASNVALTATVGFMVATAIAVVGLRTWARMIDNR